MRVESKRYQMRDRDENFTSNSKGTNPQVRIAEVASDLRSVFHSLYDKELDEAVRAGSAKFLERGTLT